MQATFKQDTLDVYLRRTTKSPLNRAFNALFLILMYFSVLIVPWFLIHYDVANSRVAAAAAAAPPRGKQDKGPAPVVCRWSFPAACNPAPKCAFRVLSGCVERR